jgi:hypothetical protein
MNPDLPVTLQTLDPAALADLVRQDQRSPAFEILDWTVQPLDHAKIIDTTGGLYRFSGYGRDGVATRPWALVLKIINRPKEECQDLREWCYWKRELLAFQSGLLADLPGGLVAPRCYGMTERDDGGWLWLEHIVESTGRRWSLEHYHQAAHQSGRFGGAFLSGTPLPVHPWLSAPFYRSVFADGGFWAAHMNPESLESAWQSPLVRRAFDEPRRSRVLRLWAEKHEFFAAIDWLPQVLCHNDLHRRNLMLREGADGQGELVALDWAFCGPGAIGADIGGLVATSMYFFEIDPADAEALEATVFDAYLSGLREAGWSGDSRLARLGYASSVALWMGATLPGWAALLLGEGSRSATTAMFGRPAEGVLAGWVTLAEFSLERADEARSLMRELGRV